MRIAAAVALLGLNLYVYHFLGQERVIPPRDTFEDFPRTLDGWTCPEPETLDARVVNNLGVTDYWICDYRTHGGQPPVNLYVGYHASQVRSEGGGGDENSIHPPRHCLPGSGWDIVQHGVRELDLPGMPERPARVNRLVIAKGEARQLVYYWYQSRGRVIADDWRKILYVSVDRARTGRTDGSLVRFTVPFARGEDEAEAAFAELAPLVTARLPRHAPE